MKQAWFVLAVAALLGAALVFRYDIRFIDDKPPTYYRIDRWTGKIEKCMLIMETSQQFCLTYSV